METLLNKYVLNGGPLMVVLIGCSLFLVAALIQAMIRLRGQRVAPPQLADQAGEAVSKNQRQAFVQTLEEQSNPLARALQMTLQELEQRPGAAGQRRQLDAMIEESVAHVADDMYEDIASFSTLYTVAPLIGLMGTILGMMKAFHEFALRDQKELEALSRGIQEALVTTLWGLGIAIVAYMAAQMFQVKIRRYEREQLPDRVGEIIRVLVTRQSPAGAKAAPAAGAEAPAAAAAQVKPRSASS